MKSASADAAGQGHELPALLAMTPQAAPWADTRASGAIGEMPDLTGQFWISGAPQASIGVPRRPARAETAECGSDLAAILLRGVRLQV